LNETFALVTNGIDTSTMPQDHWYVIGGLVLGYVLMNVLLPYQIIGDKGTYLYK